MQSNEEAYFCPFRSATIAIFLFLMNNTGGNFPLLVDPVDQATELRTALYIFWPGCVAASKLWPLF